MHAARGVLLALTVAAMAACGGGDDGGGEAGGAPVGTPAPAPTPVPTPTVAVTQTEAFRFLNQSTYGATEAEAQRLIALGNASNPYGLWIDQQLTRPTSTTLPYVEAAYASLSANANFNIQQLNSRRVERWFENALTGSDLLRQRVAFALSEIMVVSQVGALQNLPFATADFYDLLARSAFGDFRELLEDVTLHPAMGVYLSMLGNQKAVAATSLRPDENYARELMQLFSIGLVELNLDGSVRLDAQGQPIPTYDQDAIEGFARVFTGWSWECQPARPDCTFNNTRPNAAPVANYNQVKPMRHYAPQHETGTKQLLVYPGVALPNGVVPAGQSGAKDLADALDNIYNHPTVAPFISRQLIQKLVTSNPSPEYIRRVAERFNNDGSGRRGNLAAVVRAVLLDAEARSATFGEATGKVKEPLLRLTQFWRAYDGKAASGVYGAQTPNFNGGAPAVFGQGPGQSPSVFNFFSPFYAPPGEISDLGLVAPELQLATEFLNTQVTNYFWRQALLYTTRQTTLPANQMYIDTRDEIALVANADTLVDLVARKLLGDAAQLPAPLKAEIAAQVNRTTPTTDANRNTRVADAIYLIVTSPEYVLQR